MKVSRTAVFAAGLIGVAAITFALPVMPAVGQASVPTAAIRVKPQGKIADRGAVAFVPVRIACPAGMQAEVGVSLTERSGKNLATGTAYTERTCTGAFQTVTVTVTPTNAPFVRGTAFATANLILCAPFCSGTTDQRGLRLVKKK